MPNPEEKSQKLEASISYLLDTLSEERQLIATAILARNQQSTQIKQWCMTLWLASWGLISVPGLVDLLPRFYIAFAPTAFPIFFFLMEVMNKRLERKFTFRARQIHRFLNGAKDQPGSYWYFLQSGELGSFVMYDPAGANWLSAGLNEDEAIALGLEYDRFIQTTDLCIDGGQSSLHRRILRTQCDDLLVVVDGASRVPRCIVDGTE